MDRSYCSGEKNKFAKLSNRAVEKMRTLYIKTGVSQTVLAQMFNVSQQSVSRYLRYERYKT